VSRPYPRLPAEPGRVSPLPLRDANTLRFPGARGSVRAAFSGSDGGRYLSLGELVDLSVDFWTYRGKDETSTHLAASYHLRSRVLSTKCGRHIPCEHRPALMTRTPYVWAMAGAGSKKGDIALLAPCVACGTRFYRPGVNPASSSVSCETTFWRDPGIRLSAMR
jgi:hypothetical protein